MDANLQSTAENMSIASIEFERPQVLGSFVPRDESETRET